jgi:hypothetical protein
MPRGRKATRKVRYYKRVRTEYVAGYAEILLRQIRQNFSGVISFTRDDVVHMQVAQFEQVAFITRHRATCVAISYLIEHGQLIQKKFPDLCLPERANGYHFDETPITSEYAPTIKRLVTAMPPRKPFAVMEVVQRWRTDPQLTSDSKRKAVRLSMSRLVREGVCRRLSDFEYTVGGRS